jgi:hypothetical protein
MKPLFTTLCALGLLGLAAAWSDSDPSQATARELQVQQAEQNPWTHLKLNNRRKNFQFVIVTDRTGGHRPGVFSGAVDKINLMQPEFVMSVGDLIEGGTEDGAQLQTEWAEFEGMVKRLEMPFFYVSGNHDISNLVMQRLWNRKFGRSYYHFRYHDVLFLCLNTEELPRLPDAKYRITAEQQKWVGHVLEQNQDVRWTMVFLHKPVWSYAGDHEQNGWAAVERSLADRKFTAFAGHHHKYQRFERNGREFYMLATTGGSSKLRGKAEGEFDHVVWVTVKDEGPVLANLLLDGIEDKNVH